VEQENLKSCIQEKQVDVVIGDEINEGQTVVDNAKGKVVKILDDFDTDAYFTRFGYSLANKKQSAVISSFDEQKQIWSNPPEVLQSLSIDS
jgi:hypothetical protein